jgi:hypothetical protein
LTGAHPKQRRCFLHFRRTQPPEKLLLRPHRRGSVLLETIGSAELLAESLDSAGGINKLLFARKERMALIADIDADAWLRAAGHKRIPTGTVNRTGDITGMGFLFHDVLLCSDVRSREFTATSADAIRFKIGLRTLAALNAKGKKAAKTTKRDTVASDNAVPFASTAFCIVSLP